MTSLPWSQQRPGKIPPTRTTQVPVSPVDYQQLLRSSQSILRPISYSESKWLSDLKPYTKLNHFRNVIAELLHRYKLRKAILEYYYVIKIRFRSISHGEQQRKRIRSWLDGFSRNSTTIYLSSRSRSTSRLHRLHV